MRASGSIPSPSLLAILLLAALLHLPALGHDFVWDDHQLIEDNPKLARLDLGELLRSDYFAHGPDGGGRPIGYYRPLLALLFRLEYRLWGREAAGYHALNLLAHLGVIVAGWVFFLRLLPRRRALVAGACLLFALHPVTVQSVAWISGRSDLLAALFGLAALAVYLGPRDRDMSMTRALGGGGLLFAALMCKEAAAGLILIFPFLLRRRRSEKGVSLGDGLFLVPPVAFVALYLWLRFLWAGIWSSWHGFHGASPWGSFLVMGRVGCRYLRELFWPVNVPVEYGERAFAISGPWDLRALLCWALLVLLGLALLRMARREAVVAWGAGLALAALLPASQLFPFYPVASPRFLYLPSFGFALILSRLVELLPRPSWGRPERIRAGVLLCLALETAASALYWKSDLVLWQRAVELEPDCAMAWNQLGARQVAAGGLERARQSFERSMALDPRWPAAHNLVDALIHLERFDEARWKLEGFRRRWPLVADFHHQAGRVAHLQGREVEALRALRMALARKAGDADTHGLLGVVLHRIGRNEEAELALREALRLNPSAGEHRTNLEVIRRLQGASRAERRACLRRAIEGVGAPAEAYLRLARLLREGGDAGEAELVLERCTVVHERRADAWVDLARLREGMGRVSDAREAWDRAILFPRSRVEAMRALHRSYLRSKEAKRALVLASELEALAPGDWREVFPVALTWFAMGELDRARELLRRAEGLLATKGLDEDDRPLAAQLAALSRRLKSSP